LKLSEKYSCLLKSDVPGREGGLIMGLISFIMEDRHVT
jgi:hypothetical protein